MIRTVPRLSISTLAVLAVLLLMPALSAALVRDVPSRDAARRLLMRGRFPQAITAFTQITEATPEDPVAWIDLAQAHHAAGDYAAAHECGEHAATFTAYRATSLYNLACASALLGHSDEAAEELDAALAAGFLDYDLLATDTDLESLRAAGLIELPESHAFETLKHNRVEIPYVVLLPADYEPKRTYPAVVAFAPGGMGTRSTDWTLTTVWADADARRNCLVVCAAQPEDGWINHPSHHALNALMSDIRKQHNVEGNRFHFVGLGNGGRPAAVYSGMSKKYVASLTLVDSLALANWDDDDVEDLAHDEIPLTLIVSVEDGLLRTEAQRLRTLLEGAGADVSLDLAHEGPAGLKHVDTRRILARASASQR